MTAYTLGMRHAFDADHIAAIDNTTRKLMSEGKRPLSVGFWFSLGHSTVVFGLAFVLSVGVRSLAGPVRNDSSGLHQAAGWIGTLVSGTFLCAIAVINVVILFGIIRVFREMKSGRYDELELERQLASRGLMNRLLGRLTKTVTRPEQMYPIGILFGLGFDTATEVALLVLAGGAAGAGLPWYAILCLPILFAAGMSLLDTIDGSFMNFAYGWAFSKPVRKVFYNITITGLSVVVALVIGTIEVGGLVASELDLSGSFWNWFEHIDINLLGFVIVGMFVGTLGDRALGLAASDGSRNAGALTSPTTKHRRSNGSNMTAGPIEAGAKDRACRLFVSAGKAFGVHPARIRPLKRPPVTRRVRSQTLRSRSAASARASTAATLPPSS